MKDLPALFKAFVIPYLAVAFGTAIAFSFATGQAIDQLLWVVFLGALSELGIEFGAIPVVKKMKKK